MQRTTLYTAALLALALATTAEERTTRETPVTTLPLGFLIEQHFGVDRASLQEQAQWISESDLIVALQLRRQTHRDLQHLIGWRREGASWDEIARRCGLTGVAFFVPLPASQTLRGPYVRPYTFWRKSPGADLKLTDEEVRELALLRTLRDFCQLSAAEVVRLRTSGRSPETIAASYGPRREELRSSMQPSPARPAEKP